VFVALEAAEDCIPPASRSIELAELDPPTTAADEDAIIDEAPFNPRAASAPNAASACSEVATGAFVILILPLPVVDATTGIGVIVEDSIDLA
jgi:hypothetical protein